MHEIFSAVFQGLDEVLDHVDLPRTDQNAIRAACCSIIAKLPDPVVRRSPLEAAKRVQHTRMRANQILGANLLRDPCWDMLLELYIAHQEDRRIAVSGLCHLTNAPLSTALRHVNRLVDLGFATRVDDAADGRRSWVSATPRAIDSVGAMMVRFDGG